MMLVPISIFSDLDWWRVSLTSSSVSSIKRDRFDVVLFSDASNTGWGATDRRRKIYGFWDTKQESLHINYKELLAVKYALENLASERQNCRILLSVDNTTAISYINKMGGVRFAKFNVLAKDIWQWAKKRNILLLASYIVFADNTEADRLSRIQNEDTEWELVHWAFLQISDYFGRPKIDLFASRSNRKCELFCSRFPNWEAFAVDAFTIKLGTSRLLRFSALCHDPQNTDKNQTRQSNRNFNCSKVGKLIVVSLIYGITHSDAYHF